MVASQKPSCIVQGEVYITESKRGSGAVCLPSMPSDFPIAVESLPINYRVQSSLSKLPKSCELHLADCS